LQSKEVIDLKETTFRKWMVWLAAGSLLVAIIRLWIG